MNPTVVHPRPSPNHDVRPPGTVIDMLVWHYTGMRSATDALARLVDPAAKVSAHYMIDEDGTILALVPEHRRAWHAGVSSWQGRGDVNSRSIGVELVNPGHEFGYRRFPATQMAAVIALGREILARHAIPAANVVGHSDVAPSRKEDPGELFDWAGLAEAGIGLWPASSHPAPRPDAAAAMLTRYGYDTSQPLAVTMSAFQRHFRPERFDGHPDADSLTRLAALLAQSGR